MVHITTTRRYSSQKRLMLRKAACDLWREHADCEAVQYDYDVEDKMLCLVPSEDGYSLNLRNSQGSVALQQYLSDEGLFLREGHYPIEWNDDEERFAVKLDERQPGAYF